MKFLTVRGYKGAPSGDAIVDDDVDLGRLKLSIQRCGYIQTASSLLHRRILGLVSGDGLAVDHINQNKLDNRRENLRIISKTHNMHNRGKTRRNNTGLIGIYKTKGGRFVSQIQSKVDGKHVCKYLGTYDTAEQAGRAYDTEAKARSDYAVLNFAV